ncbi:MAG: alpha/beta hydrolase-fold protein [Flavobacterium sp.]|uniref:alpha/beta hydrolase-fold protein n=1 Tax=Flavobacterium sp. TaxID=239 RepID=UPI0032642F98
MKKSFCSLLIVFLFVTNGYSQQFKVSYTAAVYNKPFTGNVIAYLSKENKEPRTGSVGLDKFPCFAVAVKNIQPGQDIIIDDKAVSYPTALSDIERGEYYIQIVWDRNLGGRSIADSPGNLYNETIKVELTKDIKKTFSVVADKVVPEQTFKETEHVKELKVSSALLSSFHNKPMTVDAAVVLPNEYYTQPDRKFPVVFTVFGYGADYHYFSGQETTAPELVDESVISVFLDGNCPLGHSVYANSDNNGPWGDALTTEFIPALENKFRCNGARLLTGHSSGGWTVLWLQTQYPKVFDGCWSSSPDPVDFRNFQKINLYEDKNMFYDNDGNQRLVATVAGFIPWGTMKTIYQMEEVVYRGEQIHSFNAVFSKKGIDGKPERICNTSTGEIDSKVFEHWKKYDISANLKRDWEILKPNLQGKIRVTVGNGDNFLLNHAVKLLETQMNELKADFQFAYYPGDHFTIHTPEYRKEGFTFLKQKYMEWIAKVNAGKK